MAAASVVLLKITEVASGICIAWSCDANGVFTPGLKFPQKNATFEGTTLNICSIFCHKETKLPKMERTTFPLPSLHSSCSNRKKLTHLFPLIFMKKHKRVENIFLLLAHSCIKTTVEKKNPARSKQLKPSNDSKNVGVFLNMRQAQSAD